MALPKTSPAQNKIGEQFKPLPSGDPLAEARLDAAEAFAARVPPGVLANEVPVFASPVRWPIFGGAVPSNLTQVIQVTMQTPMPLALVLNAWVPIPDRWRPPSRIAAVNERPPGAVLGPSYAEGRFIVEWGTGPARNFVFADLAPGSLQIPIATFVRVFAYLTRAGLPPGAPAQMIAQASAYPGRQHPAPNAVFTVECTQEAGDPAVDTTAFDFAPPYVRRVTHGVGQDAAAVTAWTALTMFEAGGFTPVWSASMPAPQLVPPFAPTGVTNPYADRDCPLPGSANVYRLLLSGLQPGVAAAASAGFAVLV